MKNIKVIEAFAGIGAQRTALKNLGIPHEVVAIFEKDKFASTSYMGIHGQTLNLGDISKVDINDIPKHDLFTYSFPCQDISSIGKQKGLIEGSNTRSSLLWECKKIICSKKPKFLLMENVKNLVNKKNLPQFNKWIKWLEEEGYNNYYKIINAKDCGIPQNRPRIFTVSIKKEFDYGTFQFEKPKLLNISFKDLLEENVNDKYILSNKALKYIFSPKRFNKYTFLNFNIANCLTANGINNLTGNFICIDCSGRINESFINTLPASYRGGVENYGSRPFIIDLKGNLVRKLTPLECWRLMGFKDGDFYKARQALITTYYNGRDRANSQLYKQAGNSIVVPVLEGIFRQLFKNYIN